MPRKRDPSQMWLIPSQGVPATQRIAEVAVQAPVFRTPTYAVPDAQIPRVRPGTTVRVPYSNSKRLVEAVCVRVSDEPWDQTRRPIAEVVDDSAILTPDLIELGLWIADYYFCPPGKALLAMLPAAARRVPTRNVAFLRLAAGASDAQAVGTRPKQAALLAVIAENGEMRRDEALRAANVGPATLLSLRKRGLVVVETRKVARAATGEAGRQYARDTDAPEDRFVLNGDQAAALDVILAAATGDAPKFAAFLLFGVPGSGKTEVYVRAMRAAIAAGRQAIMIVPEIALATQIVDRLARRFDRVCVMHSRLSTRQRGDFLRAIAAEQIDVVIGTRSAVFAPCPRLGLIVVDEEQDGSLKNQGSPRFHARDVAIKRAQIRGIPVLLGSATPSLETWSNAQALPHFRLLRLPLRVGGAELPVVRHVHRGGDIAAGRAGGLISPPLHDAIAQTLAAGEQAILLHNRRGYAVHMRCLACGLTLTCTRCGAHLVYHRADSAMKCHTCGERTSPPARCPNSSCRGELERFGLAIQRLEEELKEAFPAARLQRLDSDTMRRREDYAAALGAFERREADILLGTQMVAKGLDFPAVRLVGVIEADAALWLPDFRAGERTFQLVAQVVGRAGRREGRSLAVVQSSSAADAVVERACKMDYEGFAADELEQRRRFGLPPFRRMVRLILLDERPGRARDEARKLAAALASEAARVRIDINVDEAARCVVPRLKELLRVQILIHGPRDASIQRMLHELRARRLLYPSVRRLTVDVDPVDLM